MISGLCLRIKCLKIKEKMVLEKVLEGYSLELFLAGLKAIEQWYLNYSCVWTAV